MVVYDYVTEDAPIRQGDIFKNIPFLSFNLIVRRNNIIDNTEKIIDEIIESGQPTLIETYIDSTVCILASQDCDIENDFDLIFLSLEEYEKRNVENYKQIDDIITQTTREFYLPPIKLDNDKFIGPVKINFFEPIKLPSKLIKNRLKDLRIASLKKPIRDIFIDKLKFFFSRIAMDSIMFYDNSQLQQKILEDWKNLEIPPEIKLEKMKEIAYTLKKISRENDCSEIFFEEPVDTQKVERIKVKILDLNLGEKEKNFIQLCDNILSLDDNSRDDLYKQKEDYNKLIRDIFEVEDSIYEFCISMDNEDLINEKLKTLEKNGSNIHAFKAACEYFKEMKK